MSAHPDQVPRAALAIPSSFELLELAHAIRDAGGAVTLLQKGVRSGQRVRLVRAVARLVELTQGWNPHHNSGTANALDLDRLSSTALAVATEAARQKRGAVSHLSNAKERLVFLLTPREPERATRTELIVLLDTMRERCRRLTKELEGMRATLPPRPEVLPGYSVGAGAAHRGGGLAGEFSEGARHPGTEGGTP